MNRVSTKPGEDSWPRTAARLSEFAAAGPRAGDTGRELGGLELTAPLAAPGTVYCSGANYRDHLAEIDALGHIETTIA